MTKQFQRRRSPRRLSPRRRSPRRLSPRRLSPRRRSPERKSLPISQYVKKSPRQKSKKNLIFLMDDEEKESLDEKRKQTQLHFNRFINDKLIEDMKDIFKPMLGFDQDIICYDSHGQHVRYGNFIEVPEDLTDYIRIEVYKNFYITEKTRFGYYLEDIIVHDGGKVILQGDMSEKFMFCKHFDADVSRWNVSKATSMEDMFAGCISFEGKGLETWNVSEVKYMHCMFAECKKFKGTQIENWDVSNVEKMTAMFKFCSEFNANLSLWGKKLKNVISMAFMFRRCNTFEGIGLETWDVSNVEVMEGMFDGCSIFVGNGLENWDISGVKFIKSIFTDCLLFNADLSLWGENLNEIKSMSKMFYNCRRFNCNLFTWRNKVRDVIDMSLMFTGCHSFEGRGLENWNVSSVTNMSSMFSACRNFNINLSLWGNKLSNVKTMWRMFTGCSMFQGVGLENWNVNSVLSMTDMFLRCSNLSADLSSWSIPRNTVLGLNNNYPNQFIPTIFR